ncbi:hypothetical protein HQ590_09780 [bacterium]|nr:hypothetical protein [bacterium]
MNAGGSSTATVLPTASPELEFPVQPTPSPREEVDDKLETMRDQLIALRRQQEELEHQKGDLEELRRKQDEYTRGRAEMVERLTRSLATIEREQIEARRLAESCGKTTAAFREYLDRLQSISDEEWTSATVRGELGKALGVIDDARMEYNRARTKLDCLNPAADPAAAALADTQQPPFERKELVRWAVLGAVASAPLILAGTLWLIVALVAR